MTVKIAVLLRGHIRNSFKNSKLREFINLLSKLFTVDLYIQTWHESEAKLSWRLLNRDHIQIITHEMINQYFTDIPIKNINIENDEQINIPGETLGTVTPISPMPLIGWKRFLWCTLQGLKSIDTSQSYHFILSTRFDLQEINETHNANITPMQILSWLIHNLKNSVPNKIVYYKSSEYTGIDNIYLGNQILLKSYIEYLLYNLDTIRHKYPSEVHQEYIFYRESQIFTIESGMSDYKIPVNPDKLEYDYLVVGAGLSGCVLAQQIADKLGKRVLIIDKRDHLGGNCYDYKDTETDILINKYGAHIFHTNNVSVWDYVSKYADWHRWDHKVKVRVGDRYVPLPVNQETINVLCDTNLSGESAVKEWLDSNTINLPNNICQNSRDICLARVGEKLYNTIFRDYTYKQWHKYPEELSPDVCARIPIRYNNDPRYFTDTYQGIPVGGYTNFIQNIITNPLIQLNLNTDYFEFAKNHPEFIAVTPCIYTGPIDTYFAGCGLPKLEYRSIDFQIEYHNSHYYQPESVVNYPDLGVPYTRIVEYKHFPDNIDKSTIPKTVIVKEISCDNGEPYYPVLTPENLALYEAYRYKTLELQSKIHFVGRLANYKYFNMDQAIENALNYFDMHFKTRDTV